MPDWPPYPAGPFTGEFVVGRFGGSPFQTCKWVMNQSGLVVKGLDVWYNSSTLRGVQVTFSDDSRSAIFGQPSDTHASVTFVPGERITSLTLWGNGDRHTFDVGKNTSGQSSYDADVASGILVGMVGRCGSDIDMLGPVFLYGVVTNVSISDVVYNPPLTGSAGIIEESLDRVRFRNPPDADQDLPWEFENSLTRTVSTTFTQSTGTAYGISVSTEVSAELFGIGGKIGGTYTWQRTETTETSTTTSYDKVLGWRIWGNLEPGKGIKAVSFCHHGTGQANYMSTVALHLSDSTVSTYKEPGVFSNVAYTEVEVTTEPDNDDGA
ncbi:hypothetical protein CERSUDRAFT_100959 [Gelatoporia subvermispora B]|uniref:Jacalin-type lectin domain-containing protein n=1 Tax=Ceriporiopsis subvermispora (strain B) TaxID=914234 RepID=M2QY02_CERS8|nr:hypothetical protein CERSUDRAFT_100959 [Gelatoporia subvermispora B]